MKEIKPKNLTAQLIYEAKGNPPGAHPQSAVGNFFPGLEFNFLNVWKRIFKGIELLESQPVVIAVDDDASEEIKELLGTTLISVDGIAVHKMITGPGTPVDEGGNPTSVQSQEWGNFLAKVHFEKGGTNQTAECLFGDFSVDPPVGRLLNLQVNALLDKDTTLLSKDAVKPGEMTESLCSPWQTDFIGCACYYWAANRPDYINTWEDGDKTGGHNWLNPEREDKQVEGVGVKPFYTLMDGKTLEHEDIMQDWETKLKFVIKGKDEDRQ